MSEWRNLCKQQGKLYVSLTCNTQDWVLCVVGRIGEGVWRVGGITCNDDVNECAIISGTEDECQNGGTCANNRGSYM